MPPIEKQAARGEKGFLALLGGLIGLAWLALWAWGQSPYSRFLGHEGLGEVALDESVLLLIFVVSWTLMSAAMMLPTSLPLVRLFRRLVQRRADRTQMIVLLIAGYLGVWTLFGAVAHLGDWGLHHAVEHVEWLHANVWVIGAGTLLLAGAYQFTPLKYYCLDKCRSPFTFIVEHWQGRHDQVQAFRLGVNHGIFCVGCCWPLMLLMFAVSVGNLGWMLVLATVMAVEKNLPWGRRLSTPLGVALIGLGLSVVALRAATA